MERTIIVGGSAEVRIAPDRALVHATLDADGGSRDDAYRAAARTAAAVDAVLAQHAGATERVVTASLAVQPLTKWRKGEIIRTGWRASRRSDVEVTGFEALGVLLADLAGAGATIAGPNWQVDDTNEAYDRARTLAAQDARRRADAYVEGLGMAIAGVAWIAEPGLRTSGGEPQVRAMMAVAGAARGGAVDEDVVIEVTPADATISASVEVGFDLVDRS
jgi:uncharacterized protein YggE